MTDVSIPKPAVRPPTKRELYWEAKEADDAYHAALERVYGVRASDMRYRPNAQTAEVRALYETKILADQRWLAAVADDRLEVS